MQSVLKSMTFDYLGRAEHKITSEELLGMEQAVLLDVRTDEEYETIAIKMNRHSNISSMHIPVSQIPDSVNEIPEGVPVAVLCATNVRSSMVYLYLRSVGFTNVRILAGGYNDLAQEIKPGKLYRSFSRKENV